jgi:trimeric autotransporter adhesin
MGEGLPRAKAGPIAAVLVIGTVLLGALTGSVWAQCTDCANPSFGPAGRTFPLVEYGYVAKADFNNDGVPDFAIAGPSALSIYLGDGSGGFTLSSTTPLPGVANSIVTGDFNRDGKPDTVVAFYGGLDSMGNPKAGGTLMFFGNGAGDVSQPIPIPAGTQPISLVAADFNADGKLDLAVGDASESSILIFLGNGTGGYGPAILNQIDGTPWAMAAADINGDGIPDLAVSVGPFGNKGLEFLLGTGDGRLRLASSFPIFEATGMVFADFNEDGKLDVAFGDSLGGSIGILYGEGDGDFSPPTSLGVGYRGLAAVDVNHDGHVDLLTGSQVLLGDGTGGFTPIPTGIPYGISLADDFDGDGLIDIAAAIPIFTDHPAVLNVYRGLPDDTFESPPQFPISQNLGPSSFILDLNRDGKPDLLTYDSSGNLIVYLGEGVGGFSAPIISPGVGTIFNLVTGDFNEDGIPDVVIHAIDQFGQQILAFLPGDGAGHFGLPVSLPVSSSFGLAAGDFNGDGHLDLVLVNWTAPSSFFSGDGHGHFGPPQPVALPEGGNLIAVDLNGDGKLDLVLEGGNSGTLYTFIGNGNGTFGTGSQLPLIYTFLLADVNHDGKLDLITTGYSPLPSLSPYLSVRLGQDGGQFAPEQKTPLKAGATVIAAADFNGDGKLDLAVDNATGATILLGDGAGNFQESNAFATPGTLLSAADFTGDSKPDLMGFGNTSTPPYFFLWLLPNTNCEPRRLDLLSQRISCATAGVPVVPPPQVGVIDDGGNIVSCDSGPVTASIVPGSGTNGATLNGSTADAVSGVASFPNLSINLPGRGYRLLFQHPQTRATASLPFSQSIRAPVISGPTQTCTAATFVFDGGGGYDSYAWTLDGAPAGNSRYSTLNGLSAGSHQLRLTVTQDGCQAMGGVSLNTLVSPPPPVASNNGPVSFGSPLRLVASTVPGAISYTWTGPNAFSSNLQNPTIPNATPLSSGHYSVSVLTAAGCEAKAATDVVILPASLCAGCANASFAPAARGIAVADDLIAIIAADFDRDGKIDVAIAHGGNTNKISLLRGDGRGGFAPEIVSGSLGSVRSLAAADFNGDGFLDVVIRSFTGVTVALASPSGVFGPGMSYDTGYGPSDVAIADVNHDGVLDLVVVNQGANTVSLLLGTGLGTFVPAVTVSTAVSSPSVVLVQDVNGDNNPDIIVANGQSQSIVLLLGDGHGGFTTGSSFPIPGNPVALASADFTGDGVADLVVGVDNNGTRSLAIFQGSPGGGFSLVRFFPFSWTGPIVVADLNGDGRPDIVTVGSNGATVLFGRAGAVFDPAVAFLAGPNDSPGPLPTGIAVADVTGDGVPDLIVGLGTSGPSPLSSQIAVLEGDVSGSFAQPPGFDVGFFGGRIVSSDLNRDGHMDLLVAADNGVSVSLSDGKGWFLPPSQIALPTGYAFADFTVGDVNGDGIADLIEFEQNVGKIFVFPGDGRGNFGSAVVTTVGHQITFLASADFKGNGRIDLLITDGSSAISILSGQANYGFAAPVQVTGAIQPRSVTVADFNRDGKKDFVVAGSAQSISVYLGNGHGAFGMPITTALDAYANRFAVGDFNVDGKIDLVVNASSSPYNNAVSKGLRFLAGNGAGGFGTPQPFGLVSTNAWIPHLPGDVVAADFNGDGKLDVAAALPGSGTVEVLMGDGLGGFSSPVTYLAGYTVGRLAVADINMDGRPDLAVADRFPAAVRVLVNTNCIPRHLCVTVDPSCTLPGQVLSGQPVVDVLDDGENVIACDSGRISASILNGTGTPGAVLGGTTSLNTVSGAAAFTNLSIDRSGPGYVLEFHHPIASPARTSAFTVGSSPLPPTAGSNVPACLGQTLQLTASTVPGGVYRWTGPNGFSATVQNPTIPNVTMAAAGVYSVYVDVSGCKSAPSTTSVVIRSLPSAVIAAPVSACPNLDGYVASVPDAGPGATYVWSISNGTITSGAGTPSITFSAGSLGYTTLSVTVTDSNGCSSSSAAYPSVMATACPMNFFTLSPCRVVDTRNAVGSFGGPALFPFAVRNFVLTSQCGIPPTALAVSANVTVTQPGAAGALSILAGGTNSVTASVRIDYGTSQTRANNAILQLGTSGDVDVRCLQNSGTVQFILDVNGYFQ